MNYIHQQYADYLRGKSVAVVGLAPYLLDVEQGEYIDSHDVVIRVHGGAPGEPKPIDPKVGITPVEYYHLLGKRTNVLYSNFQYYSNIKRDCDIFVNTGGRFVCCANLYFAIGGIKWSLGVQDMFDRETQLRIGDVGFYKDCVRNIGTCPILDGTMSLLDVIRHDFGKLYVTGVSNYHTADENPYDNFHATKHGYKPYKDHAYLKQVIQADSRIEVDAIMQRSFDVYLDKYRKEHDEHRKSLSK